MRLDEALYAYGSSDYYPFHMPGHKRQTWTENVRNPYEIDITEIEGFDNLHHSQGILQEAQERAAKLYGARKSYYLVNGSTAGLLSAVSASVKQGGTLLMARNCHKAAYHAAYLRGLKVKYLYPPVEENLGLNGGISGWQTAQMLERYPEIEAVLVTSPTYDGVVSDISSIARAAHAHGIPLLVDEAHGAHFPFSGYFPGSALACGADVVIHSLHKTLPAFSQTALLHQNSARVPEELLERFLGIYQSSSPSYILMAGIEACVAKVRTEGTRLFEAYTAGLEHFRREMDGLACFSLLGEELKGQGEVFDFDRSKLVFSTVHTSVSGKELYDSLLGEYHLQMEMAAGQYAIGLSSVSDTRDGFDRLSRGMLELDALERNRRDKTGFVTGKKLLHWKRQEGAGSFGEDGADTSGKYSIRDGMELPFEEIFLEQCEGRYSSEFISLYPPGIPVIVPGERINGRLLTNIKEWKRQGLDIQGPVDYTLKKIRVIKR